MRIGIFGGDAGGRTIDDVVDGARAAEQAGFASFVLPQIFGLDGMGMLAIIGREVPRIELATGVVPTSAASAHDTRHSPCSSPAAGDSRSASGSRTRS